MVLWEGSKSSSSGLMGSVGGLAFSWVCRFVLSGFLGSVENGLVNRCIGDFAWRVVRMCLVYFFSMVFFGMEKSFF